MVSLGFYDGTGGITLYKSTPYGTYNHGRWSCIDANEQHVSGVKKIQFIVNNKSDAVMSGVKVYYLSPQDALKYTSVSPAIDKETDPFTGYTLNFPTAVTVKSCVLLEVKDANEQTYYMTNILPMVANFNGKLWQKMETQVNTWGKALADGDTIFVCKGGTIDKADQILGKTIGNHVVPKYFFMALYAKTSTGQRMLGFWAEHLNEDHSNDALKGYVVSIDELEQKTGIDFFCNVADTLEEQLESKSAADIISAWGL
jgi:hypothetical protein